MGGTILARRCVVLRLCFERSDIDGDFASFCSDGDGKGSTFVLFIPYEEPPVYSGITSANSSLRLKGKESLDEIQTKHIAQKKRTSRETILMVEDNKLSQIVLR